VTTPPGPTPHPLDATGRTGAPGARALVLGGGGSVGNAWEIGVLTGLFDAGLDVTSPDLLVGTSAGATVAAQISGAPLEQLMAATLTPPAGGRGQGGRSGGGDAVANMMHVTDEIIAASADAADMRRRMGAAALETAAASDPRSAEQRRATVASRLPIQAWPERRILITAVDAATGDPIVFDRLSGIELVDAIVASTANGFGVAPHNLDGRRFIDGGYRRNENADLAEGYERVLVLSPFGGRTRHPLEWRMQLAAQVEELRAGGSAVEVINPDPASLAAFGDNMMNLAARAPAARAGYDEGTALAGRLAEFWS
jgi:NTE family protein